MDSENSGERTNNSNKDDVHSHNKLQWDLQTLSALAAKVAARITVNTDCNKDAKRSSTAEAATILPSVPTTVTKTPTINAVIPLNELIDNVVAPESNDKPLSQKSDDSDCTIQSDQSERNALKQLAAESLIDKTFSDGQTLNRILLAHSEQRITTARVELDCNSNANVTHELIPQAGNVGCGGVSSSATAMPVACGCVLKKSLAAVRDSAIVAAAENVEAEGGMSGRGEGVTRQATPTGSIRSIGSLVCRICHNSENPERLVSPCLCKGSLTYVHIHCLERWISTSRSTVCELCQFQYNTEQTLRYTCFQSLRMWYSRSMSRRALQEDCQMFSLLTLVAFGIIGTLLVGIQYYFLQGQAWGLSRMWTKGWLIFFLFTTLTIYFINIYMILKSQLGPWYRWWQSARDIKLILENRKPFQLRPNRRLQSDQLAQELCDMVQQPQQGASPTAPSSALLPPQANNTPASALQQHYQPNHPVTPTTAAINIPIHLHNIPIPLRRNTTHQPITINSIELQCIENNNNNNFDEPTVSAVIADNDVLGCYGKRPLVMATYKRTAVDLHCSKLTTAAAIEIPLENRLYEFETIL